MSLFDKMMLPGPATNPPTDGLVVITVVLMVVLLLGVIVPAAILLWREVFIRGGPSV